MCIPQAANQTCKRTLTRLRCARLAGARRCPRTGPSPCARASRKFNSLDPTPRTEKHFMKPTAYQTFILCALAAAALAGCSSGASVNPRAGTSASASATATAPDTDNASPSSSTKPKPASITPSTLPPPTVVTIPAADGGGSSSNGTVWCRTFPLRRMRRPVQQVFLRGCKAGLPISTVRFHSSPLPAILGAM